MNIENRYKTYFEKISRKNKHQNKRRAKVSILKKLKELQKENK